MITHTADRVSKRPDRGAAETGESDAQEEIRSARDRTVSEAQDITVSPYRKEAGVSTHAVSHVP